MKDEQTKIEIHLQDKAGNYVEGAVLQLINKQTGEVAVEWTTSNTGMRIEKQPIGEYIIKEVKTPTDKGYVTFEDVEIQIQDTKEVQITRIEQPISKVEIHLTDKEEGYVEGATLQLINKETGEIVLEWVTGKQPTQIEKLPIGEYIIKEVETPTNEGYVTFEDVEIEIVDTREVQITNIT